MYKQSLDYPSILLRPHEISGHLETLTHWEFFVMMCGNLFTVLAGVDIQYQRQLSGMASLFERLGGEAAIGSVVDKFYELMMKDPVVNYYFANTDMTKQIQRQKEFITLVTGGPNHYHGQDMKTAHQKMKIGKKQFDATWGHLRDSLLAHGVSQGMITQVKQIFYSVQEQIVNAKEDSRTLYERLGGEGAISAVIDKFYEFMLADPITAPFFANTDMKKQSQSQKAFITMVTGGPNNYHGMDMKKAHQKFKIGKKEFDETWFNLQKALEFFKVPKGEVVQLKAIFYSVEQDVETVKNSLYDRLGGQAGISDIVEKFYEFMLNDPVTAPYFAHTDMDKQKRSQKEFIAKVTGGPDHYHGAGMKKAHQKLKIGKKEFDETWHNLHKALSFYKVPLPEIQELKGAFYSVESEVETVKKPLFERLGGEAAINAVVDKFYEYMLADPITAPFFAKTDMTKQRQSQKDFIIMVTGGPNNYHGMDMKKAHQKFKIGKKEFDETWHNLEKALHFFKAPSQQVSQLKSVFYSVESDVETVGENKTLYERLGGEGAISAVVDKFYEFMLADPIVSPFFMNTDMDKQRKRQKQFITMVTGGPCNYEGTDMKTAHQKFKIGRKEFDETWLNLHKALEFFKVPGKQVDQLKNVFYSVEKDVETVKQENQLVDVQAKGFSRKVLLGSNVGMFKAFMGDMGEQKKKQTQKKSLFERLGGQLAINAVVDKFYEYMLADPITAPFFANTDMKKQIQSQKDFITMVTGGPNNYHGMDMKKAHQKFKIGKKEFDETWHNLEKSLHFFKVPSAQLNELKQVFYSVQSDVQTVKADKKPLYERLGGEGAISAVVDKFYEFMLADPITAPFFANTDMKKQIQSQKDFITMVTGGPNKYHGMDMKKAHEKFKIGKKEFDETWHNLHKALSFFKVPNAETDELKEVFYSVESDVLTV